MDYRALAERIRQWGRELGFQAVGIADADLSAAEPRLLEWLARGRHGEMEYMARHGTLRARPAELKPGTLRVISCRMDYAVGEEGLPEQDDRAYVARYARGRDYHKVVRDRLQKLCERLEAETGSSGYRVFTDSAPVMEVELAVRAGIGWRGKHTLLLDRTGSWFFLGEIYTDLPLPADEPRTEHCGTCRRCIDICPTQAIVAPYQLDARRCISYLTIEHKSAIPEELRPLIGNRVYGCDDCQLVCPWNGFAQPSAEPDFAVRNGLDRGHDGGAVRVEPRPSSTSGCAARRSAASGTSGGSATWRWGWAMRLRQRGDGSPARPFGPSVRACQRTRPVGTLPS
jgi:epoxyqueuosine reductase